MFMFLFFFISITRLNCALDRSTILCLYVSGFQRQVYKHVKILSERSKESKEQKKNKGSIFVAKSAYSAQNAHFGSVIRYFYLLFLGCVLLSKTDCCVFCDFFDIFYRFIWF